ncbi:maltose acetyltransferase domain-containing protein [Streptosporangium sp. NPDC023615]|uniref:maltose acetyltransferase domain-containing protein n=1 Tax=Streptosporangium sp. NPDC023615 TaxID=3154794 RepID=UPI003439C968
MTPDADGRSMRERMLAGDLYIADDPAPAEDDLRAMDLMEAFNATPARDPQNTIEPGTA